jgi:DNA-binding XRE family transcriptional regulator
VRKRLATPHSSGFFIISESREDFKMVSMPLTARIIYLRESRGLNRTRLAQLSGVSLRTLEDWEAGRRVPRDVYQIHAVAAALGMSIEDYLGL